MADDAATPGPESGGSRDSTQAASAKRPIPVEWLALAAGLIAGVLLAALVGWLGFRAYEAHTIDAKRNLFLQVARQGAVNLSSIDYERADADVQRILDSATGTFYDNFSHRSQPYRDSVKQAHQKSVGTVTEAGLESETGNEGQVLVAVTVRATNAEGGEQEPLAWRMRITVQKMGDGAKISNVAFVS